MDQDKIELQYEALRKKLLDTSMRNRMINYRLPKATGAQIVGESPSQLLRILVEQNKKMSFVGPAGPKSEVMRRPRALEELDDPDMMEEYEQAARDELEHFVNPQIVATNSEGGEIDFALATTDQTDTKLRTSHQTEELQRRLTKTYRDAKSLFEETGLEALNLALGAVKWRESEQSTEVRIAPLVFVPVSLEQLANGSYRLAWSGADIGGNLPLAIKLKEEFGIELPKVGDDLDIEKYFSEVRGSVRRHSAWEVDVEFTVLGFFHFAKLVMYEDLDRKAWPSGASPTSDPDIRAILGEGYGSADPVLSEDDPIDPNWPPSRATDVFNCDSSQALAILRAGTGASMLIEGPPGTGKSQTIANLIADAIYHGRRVLFVSEKMAALEVVYRRLDEAGLGDACLELHSKASRRREFYEAIGKVMGLRPRLAEATKDREHLADLRERLNAYAQAANEPLPVFGISPYQAVGLHAALPVEAEEDLEFRVSFEELSSRSWSDLRATEPVLAAIQRNLAEMGTPSEHPFAGCEITYVDQSLELDIRSALNRASASFAALRSKAENLAERLCLPAPESFRDLQTMITCAKRAVEAPRLDGVAIKLDTWEAEAPTVRAALDALAQLQELLKATEPVVLPAAYTADLGSIERAYRQWGSRWWRFLSGEFRREQKQFSKLLRPTASRDPAERLALLGSLTRIRALREEVRRAEPGLARLFGVQWQGEASDPDVLRNVLQWCLQLRADVNSGLVPRGLLDFFAGEHTDEGLLSQAGEIEEAVGPTLQHLRVVQDLLHFPSLVDSGFRQTGSRLEQWTTGISRLEQMAHYNVARKRLLELGLTELTHLIDRWPSAHAHLAEAVKRAYLVGVLRAANEQRPPLREFHWSDQESMIAEFRRLDEVVLSQNRARVRQAHLQNLPNWELGIGNLAVLRRQTELRRGHKPIRWAMQNTGSALQKIKPLFLMSPLSVSQFLPPEAIEFDLVIFDEASQVKPEDALPAIARAKQTIVVGDTKQMPPTSFFDKLMESDDEDEDIQSVGQIESILSLMASVTKGTSRAVDLRWHYRSQHSALIRPSNKEFYGHRLIVFPSPSNYVKSDDGELGLRWHYDPSHVYDRGNSRKNLGQARAVAQAVLRHVRQRPHESLGVAAFSKQQQEAIEDELEGIRRENAPLFQGFENHHPFERLFVKNLESVQGDERDVIYISVGYGPDSTGYFAQNFGPVNQDGGERRLNVLMTRARKRCEVFSSISSKDIRLTETPNLGVRILREFLNFVETGELDDPRPVRGEADSVFEEQVARELRSRGYEVDHQVGSIGFSIDLAVVDPERPGRYLLGIECDGATYHSAKSARDRDKLRQAALESRGWRLHRIWSTDWFRSRDGALRKCVEAIQLAKVGAEPTMPRPVPWLDEPEPEGRAPTETVPIPPTSPAGPLPVAYKAWEGRMPRSNVPLHESPVQDLVRWVSAIVEAEGPIHTGLLTRRLRTACDLGRAGGRIQSAIDEAVKSAARQGKIQFASEFLSLPGQQLTRARNRSGRPISERKPEWVAPDELELAILEAAEQACGADAESAVTGAWRLLGFQRVSSNMRSEGEDAIERLLRKGRLARGADRTLHPSASPVNRS